SDDSVSRLKGPHRPIKDEQSRALLLASLFFVDMVVRFSEDTPLKLIQALKPDILVKGGDYTEETVVGAKEVRSWGGDVQLLSFLPGYSTSQLEAKIKAS
ncbi:MAG: D-glycero-beta-D-manno-heptose 1-phosphate adenylyltransferase, partial [Bacteroidota bacterium]